MEPSFWHDIWTERKIGFHRPDVHPMLRAHWQSLGCDARKVLVPLAGKTLDMRWLADQGHLVNGVELDERAIQEFFSEWGREPDGGERPDGLTAWRADGVELAAGDFFDFQPEASFHVFYDRAALIALPESTRDRYLRRLASLVAPRARGLLITFEYPDEQLDGPPFPVRRAELDRQGWFLVEQLERREVIGVYSDLQKAGVTSLVETAYRLDRTDLPA